ncbi:hypothetical protein VTP01DRAFT_8100 [Rhizomucor pusillus]|uniref:uncharacterized protein n=1 Tax=Rhizomucor pusillus TaxID=4840 RepID=UPI003744819E
MNRATWPPSYQAVHARNAANNSNRLYKNTELQHMQPPRNDTYLNSSDDLATIYSAFSRADKYADILVLCLCIQEAIQLSIRQEKNRLCYVLQ